MTDGSGQIPKREKGRVEVRHRAGTGSGARRVAGPPQVGRIKEQFRSPGEKEKERETRRLAKEMEERKSLGFVFVAGGLCILIVAGIIGVMVMGSGKTGSASAVGDPEEFIVRIEEEEVEVSPLVSGATAAELDAEIEAVVRGFMSSETNEERCRWVNGGLATLPKMEEFYSREEESPPRGFERIAGKEPMPFGGVPMQVVAAVSPESGEPYLFNVFPGKERMLIDWESSVGYGDMAWEQLIGDHPTDPVEMRLFLSPMDYYNYEFSDDRKYQCFRLAKRARDESLYGFVERDSEVGRMIMESLPRSGELPVRIKVKFLPWSVDKKIVWIEEFLHAYWVDPETIEESLSN